MHSIPVLLSMGHLKVVVYFGENHCAPFYINCSVTKVRVSKEVSLFTLGLLE